MGFVSGSLLDLVGIFFNKMLFASKPKLFVEMHQLWLNIGKISQVQDGISGQNQAERNPTPE